MTKFVELLKASIRRERLWADTRIDDPADRAFFEEAEMVFAVRAAEREGDFPPTVPMPLPPRH